MLAWGTTGCLMMIIPTPHSDSGYARTNVVQHTQEQFVPGRNVRQDVILALGEPDAVSKDEHQLAYRSEKVVALSLVAAGGGYSAAVADGTIYKNRFFVFDFDAQGLLQSMKESWQLAAVVGAEESQLNSPALKSADSNGVTATIAGELVQHEYPKCYWLAGVEGYRSEGSTSVMGQPGHLSCTESNLAFATASEFANAEPALTLPFVSVAEVRVDKFLLGRRLVVRPHTGKVHSFLINTAGGVWPDRRAMQTVCEFIRSKIKSNQAEP